jgi:hypothetical protein
MERDESLYEEGLLPLGIRHADGRPVERSTLSDPVSCNEKGLVSLPFKRVKEDLNVVPIAARVGALPMSLKICLSIIRKLSSVPLV